MSIDLNWDEIWVSLQTATLPLTIWTAIRRRGGTHLVIWVFRFRSLSHCLKNLINFFLLRNRTLCLLPSSISMLLLIKKFQSLKLILCNKSVLQKALLKVFEILPISVKIHTLNSEVQKVKHSVLLSDASYQPFISNMLLIFTFKKIVHVMQLVTNFYLILH